jgi:hypothetical protein
MNSVRFAATLVAAVAAAPAYAIDLDARVELSPPTARSEIQRGSQDADACSEDTKTIFGTDFVVCVGSKWGAALAGFRLSPYYEYGLYLEGISHLPIAFGGYPRGPNDAAVYRRRAFTQWSDDAAAIAKTYGLSPRDFCNAIGARNVEGCLAQLAKGAP